MAKGRGSKSTKLQAKRDGTAPKSAPSTEVAEEKKARNVSEALRQAVQDLGGDDDDLDLIAGIDDSENEDEFESKKGKVSEDTVDEVRGQRCIQIIGW
jgi:ribosome biogenesis protein MAK21